MKNGKTIAIGVLLALALVFFASTCAASTIYVPDKYSTIQAAVNIASPRDTIIVKDGTYTENIKVDKRLTIQSKNGPGSTTVVAKDPDDHVFNVTADHVKISGFTVKHVAWLDDDEYGWLDDDEYGWLDDDEWDWWDGIILYNANYCNISNNKCSINRDGICLYHSNNNNIINNICSDNYWSGISLYYSNGNSISKNTCSYNYEEGITLVDSNDNKIYLNNFINNIFSNVYSSESTNTWNSTEKIKYTYHKKLYTNYLGNYGDDYTGPDVNGDGIGDNHYQIFGDLLATIDWEIDKYPLMEPWERYVALGIDVNKTVWNPTTEKWVKSRRAKVCDNLTFKITIHARCCNLANIVVTDILPCSLNYTNKSATVHYPNGKPKKIEPKVSYYAGSNTTLKWFFNDTVLKPGENITLIFRAHVIKCDWDIENVINATGVCGAITVSDDDNVGVAVGPLILMVSKTPTKTPTKVVINLKGPNNHFFVVVMASSNEGSEFQGEKLYPGAANRNVSRGQLRDDGTAQKEIQFSREGLSPIKYWFQAISTSDSSHKEDIHISNCEMITVP